MDIFGIILNTLLITWLISGFGMACFICLKGPCGDAENRIVVAILPVVNTIALLIIIVKECYKGFKSIINE